MRVEEEEAEVENTRLSMRVIELDNAVLVLLCERGERLGTLAFAMPRMGMEGAGLSSVLMGAKYHLACRILAEKAASKFGKMALVSVNVSLPESSVIKPSVELLERFKI